jgi:hypothetical protein
MQSLQKLPEATAAQPQGFKVEVLSAGSTTEFIKASTHSNMQSQSHKERKVASAEELADQEANDEAVRSEIWPNPAAVTKFASFAGTDPNYPWIWSSPIFRQKWSAYQAGKRGVNEKRDIFIVAVAAQMKQNV